MLNRNPLIFRWPPWKPLGIRVFAKDMNVLIGLIDILVQNSIIMVQHHRRPCLRVSNQVLKACQVKKKLALILCTYMLSTRSLWRCFIIYTAPIMWRAVCVIHCYLTLYPMGSQWRDFNTGVIWSPGLLFSIHTSRFWILCILPIEVIWPSTNLNWLIGLYSTQSTNYGL